MNKIEEPRRVMITAHTNSSSPRAMRWYSFIVAAEFDGKLWPLQFIYDDDGKTRSAPSTLAECVKARDEHAKRLGFPAVKGVWKNNWLGVPATLIGSPNA